ncbi:MAG TPA: chemotaxis protein CheW, partial [Polyangia bacterium]|nr:chemotaxis protein CheW [Polyangia bacterium]
QSTTGHGTSLRVKIPLTLAIIPALIVKSGGDRYAIPQTCVQELVRVDGETNARGIEHIHGAAVYRLRGQLLPLVYLHQTLAHTRCVGDAMNIVVVSTEQRHFGLVVDDVVDTEEIVVKPLARQMMSTGPFAGATILGDGRVVIILDVRAIARQAQLAQTPAKAAAPPAADEPLQTLLVLRVGDRRAAVPLDQVARLEELDPATLEQSGAHETVQYRGRILPLVRLGATALNDGERLQVVVHTDDDGRSVGLVVDRVLDIVRQPLASANDDLRSAIVQDRVTELVDLGGLLRAAGLRA